MHTENITCIFSRAYFHIACFACIIHIYISCIAFNICLLAVFDDSEDNDSLQDSGGMAPDVSADPQAPPPPDPQVLPPRAAPINLRRALLDLRKIMFTAGVPNYDKKATRIRCSCRSRCIKYAQQELWRRSQASREPKAYCASGSRNVCVLLLRTVSIVEAA